MAAPDTSAVTGTPRLLLRLEGLGLFGLAILLSVWIGTRGGSSPSCSSCRI
jgi:hypothetical protein